MILLVVAVLLNGRCVNFFFSLYAKSERIIVIHARQILLICPFKFCFFVRHVATSLEKTVASA